MNLPEDLLVPADLRMLFVDETAVNAVLESLKHMEDEVLRQISERDTEKGFLAKTLGRFSRPQEPDKLDKDAAKLKSALEICHFMQEHLRAELEKETEAFLREHCEPYKRGLAAGTLNEDWHRAICSFQRTLQAYLRELGQSRNMAATNYNKAEKQISDNAREAIAKAVLIAQELVQQTCFVNQVVDQQHELVKGTPCADNNLPRLPIADYVGWTATLPNLEIGPMQGHYDHILSLCETLVGPGIQELEQALREFQILNERANASFVLAFIERNREFAQSRWFNPTTIRHILARLEAKYDTPTLPYNFELAAEPV